MGTLEKEVETYFNNEVRKLGGKPYKFVSPGCDGVPDRLAVFPFRLLVFVELKRPKQTPRPNQWREINDIKKRDHYVVVIDSFVAVDAFINWVTVKLEEKRKRGTYKYGNRIGLADFEPGGEYKLSGRERKHTKRCVLSSPITSGTTSGIRSFESLLHGQGPKTKNKR